MNALQDMLRWMLLLEVTFLQFHLVLLYSMQFNLKFCLFCFDFIFLQGFFVTVDMLAGDKLIAQI